MGKTAIVGYPGSGKTTVIDASAVEDYTTNRGFVLVVDADGKENPKAKAEVAKKEAAAPAGDEGGSK